MSSDFDPFIEDNEETGIAVSDTGIFKLDTVEPRDQILLVHKDHTDKIYHPDIKPNGNIIGEYKEYVYTGPIIHDCLQFSEGIACGNMGYQGDESQWKEKVTGEVFGDHLWHHTQLIDTPGVAQNEDANPKLGEAYAIVSTIKKNQINMRTGLVKEIKHRDGSVTQAFEDYPYHLAAVIAVDGRTRITLESFAPYQGVISTPRPVFGMYETETSENPDEEFSDFHSVWEVTEFFIDPKTIVLTPINPPRSKSALRKRKSPARKSKSPARKSRRLMRN